MPDDHTPIIEAIGWITAFMEPDSADRNQLLGTMCNTLGRGNTADIAQLLSGLAGLSCLLLSYLGDIHDTQPDTLLRQIALQLHTPPAS